jgi:hypothetical protein
VIVFFDDLFARIPPIRCRLGHRRAIRGVNRRTVIRRYRVTSQIRMYRRGPIFS